MNTRTIIASSVAALALVAGFATPGLAQYAGNPPQYSTPEEQAQTQQLNEQAASGTTAAPAALNGEGGELNAPPPQNQAALARYRAQQAQYQEDLARYRAQTRHYNRDVDRYEQDRYYNGYYPDKYPY